MTDRGKVASRADLSILPIKAGHLIRVKNFSLFEGDSPSLRNLVDQMPGPAKGSLSEEADFFPIRQPMNLMLGFSKFHPVKTRPS